MGYLYAYMYIALVLVDGVALWADVLLTVEIHPLMQ